jgi:hypothetical protein
MEQGKNFSGGKESDEAEETEVIEGLAGEASMEG